jgi:hypothetical protein
MKWPTAWMPRLHAANAPPYREDDVVGRSRAASRVTRCHPIVSPPMAPRSTTGASSRVAPAHRVNILPTPILPRIVWRTFPAPRMPHFQIADRIIIFHRIVCCVYVCNVT